MLIEALDVCRADDVVSPDAAGANIERILKAVRTHLGMDVAFASNVTDTETVICYSDTDGPAPFKAGDSFPVEAGYCKRILDGRIPHLIQDAAAVPEVAGLACTREMPIGSHVSVPLRLGDGTVYGTFCCFSYRPDHSLTYRDLEILKAFAELAAGQIDAARKLTAQRAAAAQRIGRVIEQDGLTMFYQPIYDLAENRVVGAEALARFGDESLRGPDQWFAEAAEAGLGIDLELCAVRAALRGLPHLPPEIYLAVNVSPDALLSGRVAELLEDVPAGRVVLEITEHAVIDDFVPLQRSLRPLRDRVRIAIDDAGAGYSGLRHILDIRPDIIKLDMSLTRAIDKDPARSALASALIGFARQIDSRIVAEGVETSAELETLKRLGAHCAQGYHLQRPKPLAALGPFLIARKIGAECEPAEASASRQTPAPRTSGTTPIRPARTLRRP